MSNVLELQSIELDNARKDEPIALSTCSYEHCSHITEIEWGVVQ